MTELQAFISRETEFYADYFAEGGSLVFSSFLDAVLSGYEDKIHVSDFTDDERDEILLNALRMMQMMEVAV
ncbi:hypothetical protein [Roseibium suaedae]|uniref:Uncharacterized protein n=1 Tax=Roseibium suaedae TaxID=735517 RepID=A0A1M7FEH8_9HYPH|nr:hypothetical protein [Roseibium suaedae]SHM02400.1 hypothetical protein SAMN05444272_1589 [Roseibium suaedae]